MGSFNIYEYTDMGDNRKIPLRTISWGVPATRGLTSLGMDDESLTAEELRQLNSDTGYATGEEAKREFGLQVELP